MLEAILFGWERGAFTGAHAAHAGKFEQAQGGTLLLDEISEMPLALQAKLLRVLQEHEVERLGARLPLALDVRVLATTNRRLREDVAAGRFREDLYYRLNVFPLALTPLRGRRDDVLPLAMRLLASHCRPGERIPALDAAAGQRLLAHDWPGNVRELDNVMQRALVLCEGAVIGPEHISFEQLGAEPQPHRGRHRRALLAPARRARAAAARSGRRAGRDRIRTDTRGAAARQRQPRAHGRAPRHQPAHAALQAGAHARRRRQPSGRLERSMSQMQIDQVLSQIRSFSAHGSAWSRPLAPTAPQSGGPAGVAGAGGAEPTAFGQMLRQGIDAVNRSQQSAATLADAYERGVSGVDLAQVMLETQKASVSFRALTEVRNRLVNVYQEIMNMPI